MMTNNQEPEKQDPEKFVMSKEALDKIKQYESQNIEKDLTAYWDVDHWSIGWGTKSFEGEQITLEEANKRFEEYINDVAVPETAAHFKNWDSVPQAKKEVLVNMAYNMGNTRFGTFTRLIAAVNDNDYKTASEEVLLNEDRTGKSKFAKSHPERSGFISQILSEEQVEEILEEQKIKTNEEAVVDAFGYNADQIDDAYEFKNIDDPDLVQEFSTQNDIKDEEDQYISISQHLEREDRENFLRIGEQLRGGLRDEAISPESVDELMEERSNFPEDTLKRNERLIAITQQPVSEIASTLLNNFEELGVIDDLGVAHPESVAFAIDNFVDQQLANKGYSNEIVFSAEEVDRLVGTGEADMSDQLKIMEDKKRLIKNNILAQMYYELAPYTGAAIPEEYLMLDENEQGSAELREFVKENELDALNDIAYGITLLHNNQKYGRFNPDRSLEEKNDDLKFLDNVGTTHQNLFGMTEEQYDKLPWYSKDKVLHHVMASSEAFLERTQGIHGIRFNRRMRYKHALSAFGGEGAAYVAPVFAVSLLGMGAAWGYGKHLLATMLTSAVVDNQLAKTGEGNFSNIIEHYGGDTAVGGAFDSLIGKHLRRRAGESESVGGAKDTVEGLILGGIIEVAVRSIARGSKALKSGSKAFDNSANKKLSELFGEDYNKKIESLIDAPADEQPEIIARLVDGVDEQAVHMYNMGLPVPTFEAINKYFKKVTAHLQHLHEIRLGINTKNTLDIFTELQKVDGAKNLSDALADMGDVAEAEMELSGLKQYVEENPSASVADGIEAMTEPLFDVNRNTLEDGSQELVIESRTNQKKSSFEYTEKDKVVTVNKAENVTSKSIYELFKVVFSEGNNKIRFNKKTIKEKPDIEGFMKEYESLTKQGYTEEADDFSASLNRRDWLVPDPEEGEVRSVTTEVTPYDNKSVTLKSIMNVAMFKGDLTLQPDRLMKGDGTYVLRKIIELANKYNVKIMGTAQPIGAFEGGMVLKKAPKGSKHTHVFAEGQSQKVARNVLRRWYKKHGFVFSDQGGMMNYTPTGNTIIPTEESNIFRISDNLKILRTESEDFVEYAFTKESEEILNGSNNVFKFYGGLHPDMFEPIKELIKKLLKNKKISIAEREALLEEIDRQIESVVKVDAPEQKVAPIVEPDVEKDFVWTLERLDYHIKESYNNAVAWVSPLDFVRASTGSEKDFNKIVEEAERWFSEGGRYGKFDLNVLEGEVGAFNKTPSLKLWRGKDGKGKLRIREHEGRHRMAAMHFLGIKEVPVLLYLGKESIERAALNIKGQHWWKGATGKDVKVIDVTPLTKDNREKIIARMGKTEDKAVGEFDNAVQAIFPEIKKLKNIDNLIYKVSREQELIALNEGFFEDPNYDFIRMADKSLAYRRVSAWLGNFIGYINLKKLKNQGKLDKEGLAQMKAMYGKSERQRKALKILHDLDVKEMPLEGYGSVKRWLESQGIAVNRDAQEVKLIENLHQQKKDIEKDIKNAVGGDEKLVEKLKEKKSSGDEITAEDLDELEVQKIEEGLQEKLENDLAVANQRIAELESMTSGTGEDLVSASLLQEALENLRILYKETGVEDLTADKQGILSSSLKHLEDLGFSLAYLMELAAIAKTDKRQSISLQKKLEEAAIREVDLERLVAKLEEQVADAEGLSKKELKFLKDQKDIIGNLLGDSRKELSATRRALTLKENKINKLEKQMAVLESASLLKHQKDVLNKVRKFKKWLDGVDEDLRGAILEAAAGTRKLSKAQLKALKDAGVVQIYKDLEKTGVLLLDEEQVQRFLREVGDLEKELSEIRKQKKEEIGINEKEAEKKITRLTKEIQTQQDELDYLLGLEPEQKEAAMAQIAKVQEGIEIGKAELKELNKKFGETPVGKLRNLRAKVKSQMSESRRLAGKIKESEEVEEMIWDYSERLELESQAESLAEDVAALRAEYRQTPEGQKELALEKRKRLETRREELIKKLDTEPEENIQNQIDKAREDVFNAQRRLDELAELKALDLGIQVEETKEALKPIDIALKRLDDKFSSLEDLIEFVDEATGKVDPMRVALADLKDAKNRYEQVLGRGEDETPYEQELVRAFYAVQKLRAKGVNTNKALIVRGMNVPAKDSKRLENWLVQTLKKGSYTAEEINNILSGYNDLGTNWGAQGTSRDILEWINNHPLLGEVSPTRKLGIKPMFGKGGFTVLKGNLKATFDIMHSIIIDNLISGTSTLKLAAYTGAYMQLLRLTARNPIKYAGKHQIFLRFQFGKILDAIDRVNKLRSDLPKLKRPKQRTFEHALKTPVRPTHDVYTPPTGDRSWGIDVEDGQLEHLGKVVEGQHMPATAWYSFLIENPKYREFFVSLSGILNSIPREIMGGVIDENITRIGFDSMLTEFLVTESYATGRVMSAEQYHRRLLKIREMQNKIISGELSERESKNWLANNLGITKAEAEFLLSVVGKTKQYMRRGTLTNFVPKVWRSLVALGRVPFVRTFALFMSTRGNAANLTLEQIPVLGAGYRKAVAPDRTLSDKITTWESQLGGLALAGAGYILWEILNDKEKYKETGTWFEIDEYNRMMMRQDTRKIPKAVMERHIAREISVDPTFYEGAVGTHNFRMQYEHRLSGSSLPLEQWVEETGRRLYDVKKEGDIVHWYKNVLMGSDDMESGIVSYELSPMGHIGAGLYSGYIYNMYSNDISLGGRRKDLEEDPKWQQFKAFYNVTSNVFGLGSFGDIFENMTRIAEDPTNLRAWASIVVGNFISVGKGAVQGVQELTGTRFEGRLDSKEYDSLTSNAFNRSYFANPKGRTDFSGKPLTRDTRVLFGTTNRQLQLTDSEVEMHYMGIHMKPFNEKTVEKYSGIDLYEYKHKDSDTSAYRDLTYKMNSIIMPDGQGEYSGKGYQDVLKDYWDNKTSHNYFEHKQIAEDWNIIKRYDDENPRHRSMHIAVEKARGAVTSDNRTIRNKYLDRATKLWIISGEEDMYVNEDGETLKEARLRLKSDVKMAEVLGG